MPYALVQVSTRPARWVVVTKATLQPHSKEGMTKAKAQAQLRVLEQAGGSLGGRGVPSLAELCKQELAKYSGEDVEEALASLLDGAPQGEEIVRDYHLRRIHLLPAPSVIRSPFLVEYDDGTQEMRTSLPKGWEPAPGLGGGPGWDRLHLSGHHRGRPWWWSGSDDDHSITNIYLTNAQTRKLAIKAHAGHTTVPPRQGEEGEGLAANVYHFFTGKYQGEKALQKFLHTHGEKRIQSIRLFREPVKGALQKIVNWFTKGDLEKQMGKNAYDKLFHLSMYIELSGGASVTLEKNSAFTTHVGKLQYGVEAQSLVVPMHAHPEVREFIYNAIKRAGAKDFFVYDAFSKNCQDSMYNMLQANGLMSPAVADWIRQNLLDVAQKHPAAANLFSTITDLHGIFTGGGRPLTDLYGPTPQQREERRRRMEAEAIAEIRRINEQSRERREAIERTRRAQADAAARNRQQGQGLVSLRELLGEGY